MSSLLFLGMPVGAPTRLLFITLSSYRVEAGEKHWP
jgi:hypothetical protein